MSRVNPRGIPGISGNTLDRLLGQGRIPVFPTASYTVKPDDISNDGAAVVALNYGAGITTLTAGSGVTIHNLAGLVSLGQFA